VKVNSGKCRFTVEFLNEALDFLTNLDKKTREKILENIRISRFKNDPRLLKKIDKEIWEFRTNYNSKQIRLLAFWDKESKSLIIATHGFIKKTQKLLMALLRRLKNYSWLY
jgi:phage-related protein